MYQQAQFKKNITPALTPHSDNFGANHNKRHSYTQSDGNFAPVQDSFVGLLDLPAINQYVSIEEEKCEQQDPSNSDLLNGIMPDFPIDKPNSSSDANDDFENQDESFFEKLMLGPSDESQDIDNEDSSKKIKLEIKLQEEGEVGKGVLDLGNINGVSDLLDVTLPYPGDSFVFRDQVEQLQALGKEKLLENVLKKKPIKLEKFPNGNITIADGHHRFIAALNCGIKEIPIELCKGQKEESHFHSNWNDFLEQYNSDKQEDESKNDLVSVEGGENVKPFALDDLSALDDIDDETVVALNGIGLENIQQLSQDKYIGIFDFKKLDLASPNNPNPDIGTLLNNIDENTPFLSGQEEIYQNQLDSLDELKHKFQELCPIHDVNLLKRKLEAIFEGGYIVSGFFCRKNNKITISNGHHRIVTHAKYGHKMLIEINISENADPESRKWESLKILKRGFV